jgi:ribonucleoside-diphosphate reductase alpha chain
LIQIDYTRNTGFSDQALSLLKDYYCLPNEDPQEAFARAAMAYSEGDDAFAQRIYDYASKRWFMFSSPVLSNAPVKGEKSKGLPISCFLTYVDDTLESLIEHNAEVAWLSVKGGGVGGHWSSVRGMTDKSPGTVPFMKVVDSQMTAYKQGKTRKGSYAAYLDVSHPDIIEFINIKVPTGGDANRKCFNMFNAVNLPDAFMEAAENGKEWNLIDPSTGDVTETVQARDIWERILEARSRTGTPYPNFIDAANRGLNARQKELGLRVRGSNLCNEIHLVTDEQRTAVCCLSSVNLEKYDEWKTSTMVADLVRLLDNVLQYFIDNAPDEMHKAVYSATMERSIGIGAMGFAGLLQRNGLAWGDFAATLTNKLMFEKIQKQATEASQAIAIEKGEPADLVGTGMRNAHLTAIAPNANSSIICGCTASIEPLKSNAFTHRTRAGSHLVKNKFLEPYLDLVGINNAETWKSIINNSGSIQHLDLPDQTKNIFKTAMEIDQSHVVNHASERQQYICQGQSVNLFFPAGSPKSYVNSVHLRAWKQGLKGLYYFRTDSAVQADKVGLAVERDALKDSEECLSCHG